jgi:hypothetical protein
MTTLAKIIRKVLLSAWLLALPALCMAEDAIALSFPSVEDNIRAMDHDRDGMVTVYEVRAFIEAKHGKDYKKDVLDEMESTASGKSCSTPSAKSHY